MKRGIHCKNMSQSSLRITTQKLVTYREHAMGLNAQRSRGQQVITAPMLISLTLFAGVVVESSLSAQDTSEVIQLWADTPPGDEGVSIEAEYDTTTEDGRLVAGRRVIRLTNVSRPELLYYPAPEERANGASVLICPGGGHYVLAMDLEGTEVAEWLNSIGVSAFVLKYRVPARDRTQRWKAAVQDAQRAMGMIRATADERGLDPNRIGILGFSAGGETAGLTSLFGNERTYDSVDEFDDTSCRPDFSIMIYAANLYDAETKQLRDHARPDADDPPMFFVHTYDDQVPVQNALLMGSALKDVGVPCELHVYDRGGHGYGLRATDLPVSRWPGACESWLELNGWLKSD